MSLCTSWYRAVMHLPYTVACEEQDITPCANNATPFAGLLDMSFARTKKRDKLRVPT